MRVGKYMNREKLGIRLLCIFLPFSRLQIKPEMVPHRLLIFSKLLCVVKYPPVKVAEPNYIFGFKAQGYFSAFSVEKIDFVLKGKGHVPISHTGQVYESRLLDTTAEILPFSAFTVKGVVALCLIVFNDLQAVVSVGICL